MIGTSWHSYPKIYNLGHALLDKLLSGHVVVEEKVDGSQFSFGRFGDEVKVRSKGQQMEPTAPEALFEPAVKWVLDNQAMLVDGWTYRGEFLGKPKHNSLAYERHPKNHIILFDINTSEEKYLPSMYRENEAMRLGLEAVPVIWQGPGSDLNEAMVQQFMKELSVLGGQPIEGIVVKNYTEFGPDKKVLMGKHVSEQFKEVHEKEWKSSNPSGLEFIQSLAESYRTPARWSKAVQHLKESGRLDGSPKDIANLMKEAVQDVESECSQEIRDKLFEYAWPKIKRSVIKGLPEWYKGELLTKQFEAPAK